jgi:hypothetical protein
VSKSLSDSLLVPTGSNPSSIGMVAGGGARSLNRAGVRRVFKGFTWLASNSRLSMSLCLFKSVLLDSDEGARWLLPLLVNQGLLNLTCTCKAANKAFNKWWSWRKENFWRQTAAALRCIGRVLPLGEKPDRRVILKEVKHIHNSGHFVCNGRREVELELYDSGEIFVCIEDSTTNHNSMEQVSLFYIEFRAKLNVSNTQPLRVSSYWRSGKERISKHISDTKLFPAQYQGHEIRTWEDVLSLLRKLNSLPFDKRRTLC